MTTPIVPWAFLNTPPPINLEMIQKPLNNKKKAFVEVMNNENNIPLSQLPTPYIKGDRLASLTHED